MIFARQKTTKKYVRTKAFFNSRASTGRPVWGPLLIFAMKNNSILGLSLLKYIWNCSFQLQASPLHLKVQMKSGSIDVQRRFKWINIVFLGKARWTRFTSWSVLPQWNKHLELTYQYWSRLIPSPNICENMSRLGQDLSSLSQVSTNTWQFFSPVLTKIWQVLTNIWQAMIIGQLIRQMDFQEKIFYRKCISKFARTG